jgi:hypothetical protein
VHFIRGFHEIGTHTPKLSFSEMIRDGNGDPILDVDRTPIKKTHGHTWILKYTHTCKTSLATVIESPITGQMVITRNFTPEQQERVQMMAKTNIAGPCLYRVMLNMYPDRFGTKNGFGSMAEAWRGDLCAAAGDFLVISPESRAGDVRYMQCASQSLSAALSATRRR